MKVRYCIVGGGYAAAAAIEGIRSRDQTGDILMLSRENHRPYRRPLLTKELLLGTASLDRLPLHPDDPTDPDVFRIDLRQFGHRALP